MESKEKTPEAPRKPYNIFKGTSGDYSMRRALAFLLAISGIVTIIISILKQADWKCILIAGLVPLGASVLLLLFTTWGDIQKVIKAVKGDDDDELRH